jgi:hypothetical protein
VVGMALDAQADQESKMNHVSIAAQIGLALPVGLLCGAAYFTSLRWVVERLGAGEYAKALCVHCVRFGLLAAIFFGLVGIGAAALLSGALGLMLARQFVLHRARPAP